MNPMDRRLITQMLVLPAAIVAIALFTAVALWCPCWWAALVTAFPCAVALLWLALGAWDDWGP